MPEPCAAHRLVRSRSRCSLSSSCPKSRDFFWTMPSCALLGLRASFSAYRLDLALRGGLPATSGDCEVRLGGEPCGSEIGKGVSVMPVISDQLAIPLRDTASPYEQHSPDGCGAERLGGNGSIWKRAQVQTCEGVSRRSSRTSSTRPPVGDTAGSDGEPPSARDESCPLIAAVFGEERTSFRCSSSVAPL